MKLSINQEFAQWLDGFVKREGIAEEAYLRTVSSFDYPGLSSFDSMDDLDYDTDKYRVITVVYPYEYHACALNISTPMLKEELRFHKPKTDEDIIEMLKSMIEI